MSLLGLLSLLLAVTVWAGGFHLDGWREELVGMNEELVGMNRVEQTQVYTRYLYQVSVCKVKKWTLTELRFLS